MSLSLVVVTICSFIAAPAADAFVGSSLKAPLTRYDVRATAKVKRSVAKKKRLSLELPAIAKGGLVFGDPEATTTIVMFTDIECPFCKRFHEKTYPSIKKEYIDTKSVRFVIRHFPLVFHPYADRAARVVVCAREQSDDKARAVYDALMAVDTFETGTIASVYKEVDGLDAVALETCLDTGSKRMPIDDDAKAGVDAGVRGTPSFFIIGPNGASKTVTGAFPYETFKEAIEAVQKK